MGKSRSHDAALADLKAIYEKMGLRPTGDGRDRVGSGEADEVERSRHEMLSEIRSALREGLVSTDRVADEIINDILLTASNPQDRLRAAELIKKSASDRRSRDVGTPPTDKDLERFFRIVEETVDINKSINEKNLIAAPDAEAVGTE